MHKWIQHPEKPLGHSDYTDLTIQIFKSNNFLPDFGKIKRIISPEKSQNVERLDGFLKLPLTLFVTT
jgi:hypothetical protein